MIEGYIKVLQYWTHVTESFVDFGPCIDSWKFEDQPSLLKKIGSNQIFKIRFNTKKNSLYKLTRNVTIVMFQNSTAKFQRNDLMIYSLCTKWIKLHHVRFYFRKSNSCTCNSHWIFWNSYWFSTENIMFM